MSNTAESILDQMRRLPRSEVDDVRRGINALLSLGALGESETENTSDGYRVFRIIAEEMQAAGLADVRSAVYARLQQRRDFNAKAEHLVAFLREQSDDRLVQDGILRFGVQLLIRFFRRYAEEQDNFVVTVGIICRNIHKVPARLDREFPGYAACGMLHLLIPHP